MEERLDPRRVARRPGEAFERGVELFDARRFWEAHEFFEHAWKDERGSAADRDFWKGVTQVAVGFCHVQRGNAPGAVTLLRRAAGNLGAYPSPHLCVDTRRLEREALRVASEIEATGDTGTPTFPRFPLVGPSATAHRREQE
jgi:predicted metal-dependent hydrolase